MATIDRYKIVLDVEGQAAVDRLRGSVTSLGTTIAGLAFGGFITGAMRMADAMVDVASATGLTAGSVKALALSLEEAGGSFDDVGKLVTTFYGNLESAASGTEKIQNSLAKVGISLNDLRTLSEQQLLDKAIDQLGRMEAGAARTALGVEIFGKSFKTVDPKILQQVFATKDINLLNSEMEKTSELIAAMEHNFRTLQQATLNLLAPLIGDMDKLKLSVQQAEKIIKIVGGALLLAFGASVVANVIDIVKAVIALTKALRATAIVQTAIVALTGPKGWAVIAGAVAATTGAVIAYNKALEDTVDLQKEANKAGGGTGTAPTTPTTTPRPAFPNAQQFTDQELQARKQAVLAAQQLTNEMRLQNNEALKLRDLTISLIGEETNYANLIKTNAQVQADGAKQVRDLESKIVAEKEKGRGTNQQVIAQYQAQIALVKQQTAAQVELNQKEYDRIKAINDAKLGIQNLNTVLKLGADLSVLKQRLDLIQLSGDALKLETGYLQESQRRLEEWNATKEKARGLVDPADVEAQNRLIAGVFEYGQKVKEIQSQFANGAISQQQLTEQVTAAGNEVLGMVEERKRAELEAILIASQAEQARHNNVMKFIADEVAAQRAKQSALELTQLSATDQASLDAMTRRLELIGLYGDQLEIAQSKLQIEEELQNKLLAIEKQRIALGASATQAELDHLAKLERAARDYADKRIQIDQQRMEREKAVQQSAEKGIEAAMAQIEKMNTPFNRAQQATTALFNNMNNAIDNFVKTGKFSFKDFARSVIQDILAIELKAQATKLLGSLLGKGGSIFDLFAGMFKAEGGPVDKNSPYIVGEKGPELFVPSSSGKIISNGQTMGMARSSAPAQVSAPINNTYITNNISAVDAKSVAQLFAENRKTLLGTVEMARKELPYATR